MPVKLRGKKWHYRFHIKGKSYSGICVNCENEKQAVKYEAEIRKEAETIRTHKSVVALVENYRRELTGGNPIPIKFASRLAAKKPARRSPSQAHIQQRNRYWDDFTAFMEDRYPDIINLDQVTKLHCEDYVSYLNENGRFVKVVKSVFRHTSIRSMRKNKTFESKDISYQTNYLLAAKTIKSIASVIGWVFRSLADDAGIVRNPMENIVLPVSDETRREIFTEEELAAIREGVKTDEFCRPLFVIAAMTGLTEGDICTLKWSEIDFRSGVISHRRRKTGVQLEIPITRTLENYLLSIPQVDSYVLPAHAVMYLRRSSDISVKVKQFLNRLGIENVKQIPGRRAVSVKDLHSMRHVFCFYAGQAGIPITTVQSIVGHLTPEMTRHYSSHDSLASKQRALEKMPLFLSLTDEDNDEAALRSKLADLAYSLPLDEVKRLVQNLSSPRRAIEN